MSRIFIRIETTSGSRTIISNEVPTRDASEIAQALAGHGLEIVINDDVVSASYTDLIIRKRRLEARLARKKKPSADVIQIKRSEQK